MGSSETPVATRRLVTTVFILVLLFSTALLPREAVTAQTPAVASGDQSVSWPGRDGDVLHPFAVRFSGCSVRGAQAACNIVITNRGSSQASFRLHAPTSYAVNAEGRVHFLRAVMIGARTVDVTGYAAAADVDAEPGLPNAVTLLFESAPREPAKLRLVLGSGDRPRPLIVLNAESSTQAAVKPLATTTTTKGELRVDLLECTRTPVRLDCAIQITNLQGTPADVGVPLTFGGLAPGTYRDESTPKTALVDFKLGSAASLPQGILRVPPALPIRSSFSVVGVREGSREGVIEISLQHNTRAIVTASFAKVPVGTSVGASLQGQNQDGSAGVSVQQGAWLYRLTDCVQTNTILACTGSVTNGSLRPELLDVSVPDSYLLLSDGEQRALKLLAVGDAVVSLGNRRAPRLPIEQDAKPTMRLVFTRVPRDMKNATVMMSSGSRTGRREIAPFRDLQVTQGQVAAFFNRPEKAFPRVLPLPPDATTTSLKAVLQNPAASVLDKEAAAEQLWDRFKDAAAKTFLIRSYREFLEAQAAAAFGPQATVSSVCAGFDSGLRKTPCGRISILAPRVLSLGDSALYVDLVRLMTTGRIGADGFGEKVLAGVQGAPKGFRSLLAALLDDEAREFARRESAGWSRQAIEMSYARVLQLMLGVDAE